MVMLVELIGDDATDDRGSPNAGLQTISHRTAVQNILQLFPLRRIQSNRTARTMALQQSLLAVLVPVFNPKGNAGAMDFERLGDLTGGSAFDAQGHGVKALGHTRLLVFNGFLTQLEQ